MDLRDIDVNEPAETPTPSVETPAESVEVPKETPQEQPKPAEKPAKEPTEDPGKGQEEEQEPKPQEPAQPKRSRAEERIQEVVAEKRNLARENAELKAKVENFSKQTAPELQKEEIAYDDLNRVINERALQAAELIVASQRVGTQVQNQAKVWAEDFEKVKSENPQLDPKSPEYDKDLDITLAKLLDDGTGMPKTDVLVSDVIKQFKKRESATQSKAIEEGKSQASAKLAQQQAEGAITPSSKTPSKTDEELSDEESAELRAKNPKEWFKRL